MTLKGKCLLERGANIERRTKSNYYSWRCYDQIHGFMAGTHSDRGHNFR